MDISETPKTTTKFKSFSITWISQFRLQAVAIHLLVSSIVITVISVVALLIWFPYPMFLLDDTWVALLTVAVVDLSLGPLITLIISSDKKSAKELIFDFSIILVIQLFALGFGLFQIHNQRIVAFVHLENEFHMVSASSVPAGDPSAELPSYKGKHYGVLLLKDFSGLNAAEMELKMYSPSQYRIPSLELIKKTTVRAEAIPNAAVEKYGEEAIFIFIVGKTRHGIAVMNDELAIMDIYLANRATNLSED